jgi:Protein of unknown function with PCYCGC motif
MPKSKDSPSDGTRSKSSNSRKTRKPGKSRWIVATLAAALIVTAGAVAWTMRPAANPSNVTTRDQHVTLDPARFFGEARAAYTVAEKKPALLAQLHCYCGCDKELGHQNLLDCFRDEHGSHCPVCTGEAVEAAKLDDEGLPVEQIRRVLRDHYAQEN